jgi:hypothetical protein
MGQKEQDEKSQKITEEMLNEMVQRRNALMILVTQPGWKVVSAEFQKAADHAYNQAIHEQSPHRAAVYLGTHYASENVVKFPVREIERINLVLKTIKQG